MIDKIHTGILETSKVLSGKVLFPYASLTGQKRVHVLDLVGIWQNRRELRIVGAVSGSYSQDVRSNTGKKKLEGRPVLMLIDCCSSRNRPGGQHRAGISISLAFIFQFLSKYRWTKSFCSSRRCSQPPIKTS